MSSSCSDICEIVHERLAQIGFPIGDDEDHDDMIEALGGVRFIAEGETAFRKEFRAEDGIYHLTRKIVAWLEEEHAIANINSIIIVPDPKERYILTGVIDYEYDPHELWEYFGETPIGETGDEIEDDFLHFPAGTDRFEIWHWFEETFDGFLIPPKYVGDEDK